MKKLGLFLILFILPFQVYARNDSIEVELFKCVDGDTATFLYENEEMKTRFLAIDTPETKHPSIGEEPFGKEASEYTCNTLEKAEKIILEFDENSDEKDKYNRYLVWVFVDDVLLQDDLVKQGLAKIEYIYGDYKYLDTLEISEKYAKENKIGIWEDYTESPDYTIYYIVGGILLLIIIALIIPKIKNKQIKKLVNKVNSKITKDIKINLKNR